jgi:hypothetical protein
MNLKAFYTNESGDIKIIRTLFVDFLEANGFHKLKMNNRAYRWIRVENNVVEEIGLHLIKDFVIAYCKTENQEGLREAVLKVIGSLMSNSSLEALPTVEYSFKRGTRDLAFYYFENGFVEISKESAVFKEYSELDLPIWKSKIIQHNIKMDGTGASEFMVFVNRLCNEDRERFKSLCSIIGYLIHDYKDPSRAKAVILTDTTISHDGTANGGTGKSLLMKGVAEVVDFVSMDGKNLKTNSNFFFQQVTPETEVLYYDDVKQDFSFESLYSAITKGIDVEKKYQTAYHIPYAEAPKIVISSNYVVRGTGGNTDARRRIDFEVSDYYRLNPDPAAEFGHLFFDDWNDEQWNDFYLFMFSCVQLYLQEGLIGPEPINIALNTLTDRTCPEFPEFAAEELLNEGSFDKDDLLKRFKQRYPGKEGIVGNTFTKWINNWAGYQCKSVKIIQKQSNGKNMVYIYHVRQ